MLGFATYIATQITTLLKCYWFLLCMVQLPIHTTDKCPIQETLSLVAILLADLILITLKTSHITIGSILWNKREASNIAEWQDLCKVNLSMCNKWYFAKEAVLGGWHWPFLKIIFTLVLKAWSISKRWMISCTDYDKPYILQCYPVSSGVLRLWKHQCYL